MTDIVERAREWLKDWGNDCQTCQELISELAAEIERLRDEVALWKDLYEAESAWSRN
jgi:hypothetical protein